MNKQIWATLSKINCNEHTEKKGQLTYLSWAWAWGTLMKYYPTARYQFTDHRDASGNVTDVLIYQDGSGAVECTLTIEDLSRTMSLPVMDHRNQAIQNPNARQISDTKMRCLTKAIAMFGLGHYIYAGEDLPENTSDTPSISVQSKAHTETTVGDRKLLAGPVNMRKQTYGEVFKDDMHAVTKQIAYWQKRKDLDQNQSDHLVNLTEYATILKNNLTDYGIDVS